MKKITLQIIAIFLILGIQVFADSKEKKKDGDYLAEEVKKLEAKGYTMENIFGGGTRPMTGYVDTKPAIEGKVKESAYARNKRKRKNMKKLSELTIKFLNGKINEDELKAFAIKNKLITF